MRWGSVGAVIAAVGVVAGIWFSAFSAFATLDQQRQTRQATELGLLTQLTSSARAAFAKINGTTILEKVCVRPVRTPTPAEEAAVLDALGTLDYLSWLQLNGEMQDLPRADAYWRESVLGAYRLARRLYRRADLNTQFPSLVAVVDDLGPGTRAPRVCG